MSLYYRINPVSVTVLLVVIVSVISCQWSEKSKFTCTDPLGCVTVKRDEPVYLGVLQALGGGVAALGRAQIRGLELALDKRQNMIAGHPIHLQIEDTGCTAEGGANAALKIIAEPQTVAIFGTTCSGAAATASSAMSAAGLTMVSGNNSAPFLTSINGKPGPNWHPGYFRTASNEENAGRVAAQYSIEELGVDKAATIDDGDIYTRGLTDSFRQGFESLGGSVVLHTSITKGDLEMEPVLKAVIESGASLLFFPLFQPEGNNILRQARSLDALKNTILMSDGALIQETFLKDVGVLATGMYFIGPAKPVGAAVDELAARYLEKYKEVPAVSYYLSGYDAADVLLHGIEKTAIQGQDGELFFGRQALRDTLYGLSSYRGVTGTLSCNRFGDCAESSFSVLRMDDPVLGLAGLEANILNAGHLRESKKQPMAKKQ